jgi:hypothetical protein
MILFVGIFSICHLQLTSTVLSIVWRDGICCRTFITLMNRQYFQDRAAVNSGHSSNVILCGMHNPLRSLETILIICFCLFAALYLWRQEVKLNSIDLLLHGIKNLYMTLSGWKSTVMFEIRITLRRYLHSDFKASINLYPTKLPPHPRYRAVHWRRYLLKVLNFSNTGNVYTLKLRRVLVTIVAVGLQ